MLGFFGGPLFYLQWNPMRFRICWSIILLIVESYVCWDQLTINYFTCSGVLYLLRSVGDLLFHSPWSPMCVGNLMIHLPGVLCVFGFIDRLPFSLTIESVGDLVFH